MIQTHTKIQGCKGQQPGASDSGVNMLFYLSLYALHEHLLIIIIIFIIFFVITNVVVISSYRY